MYKFWQTTTTLFLFYLTNISLLHMHFDYTVSKNPFAISLEMFRVQFVKVHIAKMQFSSVCTCIYFTKNQTQKNIGFVGVSNSAIP